LKKSKHSIKGKALRTVAKTASSSTCQHEYQFVQKRSVLIPDASGPDFEEMAVGYCPKCDTTHIFTKEDWDAVLKIQDIRKKYAQ